MKRLYYCELRVNGSLSSRYVLARNALNACDLVVQYYNMLYPNCTIIDVSFTPVEYVSQQIINTYLKQFNGNN